MSFNPRKFGWHPGLTWFNQLNLKGRAQDPYTAYFTNAAKTRPADYGRGITNLASHLDDYVFDQTDPERIAARKEAARQRAEAERLSKAQGALDAQIMTLSKLLAKDPSVLPADVSAYKGTLATAKQVRATNDPAKMQTQAEQMKGSVAVLEKSVDEAESAARMKLLSNILLWLFYLTMAGLALFALIRRRRLQIALQDKYTDLQAGWMAKVSKAKGRWSDHYLERDDIIGLDNITGRTKALWDSTTKMVDDILVRITAIEHHVLACNNIAAKAHFLNLDPLRQAIEEIDASFEFDTGKVNETNLFGGETVTVRVVPSKFAEETKRLFEQSIDGWKRLKRAAEERLGDVREDFPHTNLDRMFDKAEKYNIPTRWFQNHPLFGDDASDKAFYDKLNTLRETDPLAYVEEIERVRKTEQDLMEVLDTLVSYRTDIAKTKDHVGALPDLSGTTVRIEDDPRATLNRARQAEDILEGKFATGTQVQDVAGVVSQVVTLYGKVREQVAVIQSAIKGVVTSQKDALSAKASAEAAFQKATRRVFDAKNVFSVSRIAPAEGDLKTASEYIAKGTGKVEKIDRLLSEKRHLDARRAADEAKSAYMQAVSECRAAENHIVALEKEKAEFEKRVASMADVRSRYDRKMSGFGSHRRSLPVFQQPTLGAGPLDYAVLAQALDRQESSWRSECRRAEEAYEDEQRRIREAERRRREAEEAARRAAEEEERRRSYYSSSSSSSSSDSWGGGGFGGGGGDFGGGGFGGSSGDF